MSPGMLDESSADCKCKVGEEACCKSDGSISLLILTPKLESYKRQREDDEVLTEGTIRFCSAAIRMHDMRGFILLWTRPRIDRR